MSAQRDRVLLGSTGRTAAPVLALPDLRLDEDGAALILVGADQGAVRQAARRVAQRAGAEAPPDMAAPQATEPERSEDYPWRAEVRIAVSARCRRTAGMPLFEERRDAAAEALRRAVRRLALPYVALGGDVVGARPHVLGGADVHPGLASMFIAGASARDVRAAAHDVAAAVERRSHGEAWQAFVGVAEDRACGLHVVEVMIRSAGEGSDAAQEAELDRAADLLDEVARELTLAPRHS